MFWRAVASHNSDESLFLFYDAFVPSLCAAFRLLCSLRRRLNGDVVERTFAWLGINRRLTKDFERFAKNKPRLHQNCNDQTHVTSFGTICPFLNRLLDRHPIKPPSNAAPKRHVFGSLNIFPIKRLKAQEIADFLTHCEIPCHKRDVDNGVKIKEFIPHAVPNCAETRELLDDVKRFLFPRLRISEFLAKPSKLNLNSVERSEFVFADKMT